VVVGCGNWFLVGQWVTVMGAKTDLESWCEKVAALGVDALVDCELVRKEDFERAKEIVAGEILVRLCLRDYPPADDQSDR
jgi:hypothetical protein